MEASPVKKNQKSKAKVGRLRTTHRTIKKQEYPTAVKKNLHPAGAQNPPRTGSIFLACSCFLPPPALEMAFFFRFSFEKYITFSFSNG
jgi:hypothetical protein